MQHLTSGAVAFKERADYWNRACDETFPGTAVDFAKGPRLAEMWRVDLGELTMIRPRSDALVVERRHSWLSDPREERMMVHLLRRGRSRYTRLTAEADLSAGDFVFASSSDPYRMELGDGHELLVVELPRRLLAEKVADLDRYSGVRMAGYIPAVRVLHEYLLSLWRHGEDDVAGSSWVNEANDILVDLFALAIRNGPTSLGADRSLSRRMVAIAESQLSDPELRASSLAGELNVSVRTIHNLFARMATTPSAYILDRRLERAAELLHTDPERSITELAMDLGFNDSNYFTRCFRARFGKTPSAWRQSS